MNKNIVRLIMALPAIPMALTTLNFVINPSKAAEALGMELLTGIGLSTQLGDFGAFFAVAAFLIGAGSLFMKSEYFKIAALLFGSAALFRTIAWALNGAEFATSLIISEVVLVVWMLVSAEYIKRVS